MSEDAIEIAGKAGKEDSNTAVWMYLVIELLSFSCRYLISFDSLANTIK